VGVRKQVRMARMCFGVMYAHGAARQVYVSCVKSWGWELMWKSHGDVRATLHLSATLRFLQGGSKVY